MAKLTSICAGCGKVLYQGGQPAYAATSYGTCIPCMTKIMWLDGDSYADLTEFVNDMTKAGF